MQTKGYGIRIQIVTGHEELTKVNRTEVNEKKNRRV